MKMNDIAIIGAGPGGIACAVQLARYGIIPMVFEKDLPGGLLKNANLVENFPGFPGGISGMSLVSKLTKQLELSGVNLVSQKVNHVTYQSEEYKVVTDKMEYSFKILVLASGTSPIEFPVSSIDNQSLTLVFYEVFSIRDVRNANIAIIGAGDAAFDYAMQMSLYNKVFILNRSDRVKCLPLLFQRAMNHPRISYYENHVISQIEYEPSANCSKITCQHGDNYITFLADYIIFAIGRRPEFSYADTGLISLFDPLQEEKKLYLVGDVKNDLMRQASIAAGDGIRAAMQIYFNESNKKDLR
jgi:thioredoxin reductase